MSQSVLAPTTTPERPPAPVSASQPVQLDLRSRKFTVNRDSLMELPESVLLCLFPNGLVLGQRHSALATPDAPRFANDPPSDDDDDDDQVYYVDFDGSCLSYILSFFSDARTSYYGAHPRPQDSPLPPQTLPSPLFYKQAIIVLREELEYFPIPGHTQSDNLTSSPDDHTRQLKRLCADSLLGNKSIFTPLQRNINRENNVAEQHLIDMLCMSGFNREDEWGYRSIEPRRCCITSLSLVILKTGITHDHPPGHPSTGPTSPTQMNPQVNGNQLTTAQKLLLFWRKPARKCWWDVTQIEVPLPDKESHLEVKLWARRVWTLELSLI